MNNLFLNLTNANPQNRGMPLAIRRDLVLTVHSNLAVREDGTAEMVTYIHCPPHGTWEVLENYIDVWQQLNNPESI